MKKLLLIPIFLSLVGCAPIELTPKEAVFVEPIGQSAPSATKQIKVTLLRDYGMATGVWATIYIYDNGERVAKLNPKEMTIYYASLGNHNLEAKNYSGSTIAQHFSEFKNGEHPEIHFGFGTGEISSYFRRTK